MVVRQRGKQYQKPQMLLSNSVYQRILQVVDKLKTGGMVKHKLVQRNQSPLQIHYQRIKKQMELLEQLSLILLKIQDGH